MCDIWKDNRNLKQLTEEDVAGLLKSLQLLDTRQVVMSGGEALLNPAFFTFCEILKKKNIQVVLLTTGLTIKQHAGRLVELVDEMIISLDGDETLHDRIRNIPGAYKKLRDGINHIRSIRPGYRISGRTVIHKLNYRAWPQIIESAKALHLNSISFLPADVSSQAFNRPTPWDTDRQQDIQVSLDELPDLEKTIEKITLDFKDEFSSGFIAESPDKLRKIYSYYSALNGLNDFPYKKCNAPWVSTVIEADGSVRPCFFHPPMGNIRRDSLPSILNSPEAKNFRRTLDMNSNPTCVKCVCYLNLKPSFNPASN